MPVKQQLYLIKTTKNEKNQFCCDSSSAFLRAIVTCPTINNWSSS